MHVREGLFDLLEGSLHIIVENVGSGVEKTSTVQYMQKLFQQSYDTWLEGWRQRLTAQSCKVSEESWEPSDKPWRVSRTMAGLRDTYKDFITEALPHIGTLPHFRQVRSPPLSYSAWAQVRCAGERFTETDHPVEKLLSIIQQALETRLHSLGYGVSFSEVQASRVTGGRIYSIDVTQIKLSWANK